ncbi:MAG TPA: hypothetical protein VMU49_10395 [Candidatus Acidoferrales bacterium]|nr:hypothetical protein [Candidatus Acidoferrales bacterium]
MSAIVSPLRMTFVACVAVALVAMSLLTVAGHPAGGAALALGLLLGSGNGLLIRRSLHADLGFRTASLGRLALLSAAGVGLGALLGVQQIALVLIGIGVSQLLLAGAAGYQLVRQ